MRALIVIGTTGGHIYPGIMLADKLIKEGNEVVIVSRAGGIAAKILEDKKYDVVNIAGEGLKRKLSFSLITFLFKFMLGFFRSFGIIRKFKPDIVIGMGGYLTPPVILASKFCLTPSIVHEQNVLPGLAIKVLSSIADRVAVSFEETKTYLKNDNVVFTGNPVRQEMLKCPREAGEKILKLKGEGRNVLIFGGSQGSASINHAMVEALKPLEPVKGKLRFIHIAGPKQFSWVKDEYVKSGHNACVFDYLHKMEYAYACADLAVSRAGATTIAELIAISLPCILVPYPHATANHQMINAQVIADTGGGIIIKDDKLNGAILADSIMKLFRDTNTLENMKGNIGRLYKKPAVPAFIKLIQDLIS